MAENSKIEWTDHTFNPWIGCAKVSEGCANCYAAVDSPARIARAAGNELWGPDAGRKHKAESGWQEPYRWNQAAHKAGKRLRVFTASQADIFEDRGDLVDPRHRLLDIIRQTPHLDWLVLTKRWDNILPAMQRYLTFAGNAGVVDRVQWASRWLIGKYPSNMRIGLSIENQRWADTRLQLLKWYSGPNFLSIEPLLGPIDLTPWLSLIHWAIVGGESGDNARPMHPDWVRSLRDQCTAAGVPFHFKQWGCWVDVHQSPPGMAAAALDRHEVRFGEWHDEAPEFVERCVCGAGHGTVVRAGKKLAGRTLDGRTWDEFPAQLVEARP